jgi:type II secretory pathway pseudopilin PulG
MQSFIPIRRPARPSEEGFGLLAVIFLVALLTISLAIAMPKVARQIQRDRELETMNRGKQYARAVRMYYKKFGAYPPNVDALVKPTNNIRFLRKKYADPTTGKEDWKPVLFGMNKAPTAMGFFGQPLGGIGACVATDTPGGGTSQSSSSAGASSFGSTSGSPAGTNANCAGTGLNPSTSTSTSTDPNAASGNSSTNSSSNSSAFGQSGQTFGGAGIIGFSPNSPKASIMVYKKKTHYDEWEFVYDPKAEQMMSMPGGGLNNNAGINNNPSNSGSGLTGSNPGVGAPGNSASPPPNTPSPWSPNGNLSATPQQ